MDKSCKLYTNSVGSKHPNLALQSQASVYQRQAACYTHMSSALCTGTPSSSCSGSSAWGGSLQPCRASSLACSSCRLGICPRFLIVCIRCAMGGNREPSSRRLWWGERHPKWMAWKCVSCDVYITGLWRTAVNVCAGGRSTQYGMSALIEREVPQ